MVLGAMSYKLSKVAESIDLADDSDSGITAMFSGEDSDSGSSSSGDDDKVLSGSEGNM